MSEQFLKNLRREAQEMSDEELNRLLAEGIDAGKLDGVLAQVTAGLEAVAEEELLERWDGMS